MNVHKIWLLLLFLLIPTILFAQKTRTVKGLVCTTSETKKGEEPLPYASLVILEGKDSTFVKGVASDADGRFILRGRGWGHGVGLCQIGAAVMGAKGYSAREILQHYFPKSTLTKIYE